MPKQVRHDRTCFIYNPVPPRLDRDETNKPKGTLNAETSSA
ncbi:MAG: hypothetical protein ABIF17_04625 [Patescibacteria group bacterium]